MLRRSKDTDFLRIWCRRKNEPILVLPESTYNFNRKRSQVVAKPSWSWRNSEDFETKLGYFMLGFNEDLTAWKLPRTAVYAFLEPDISDNSFDFLTNSLSTFKIYKVYSINFNLFFFIGLSVEARMHNVFL